MKSLSNILEPQTMFPQRRDTSTNDALSLPLISQADSLRNCGSRETVSTEVQIRVLYIYILYDTASENLAPTYVKGSLDALDDRHGEDVSDPQHMT